jgi:hypothetical protein
MPALGPTQPPTQRKPGFFLGEKRPGSDACHLPSSRAEVKNDLSYTSAPPICLHGVGRDNFTFIIYCICIHILYSAR